MLLPNQLKQYAALYLNLVIEIGVAHFLTGHVCEDLSDDDISVGKVVFEGYQLEPVEQALDDVGRVQRLLLEHQYVVDEHLLAELAVLLL